MSRFTQELKVVPKTAWIIGAVMYLGVSIPLFLFAIPNDPELGTVASLGSSLIRVWNVSPRIPVRRIDRLRVWRRKAARHAIRDVDAASVLRALFDRRDPLLYLAQPFAEGLSGMRRHGEIWIHLLPEVRHGCAANMP